ncbi:hypothetical protein KCU90_g41, partial [Aureobasidium melanogenum]
MVLRTSIEKFFSRSSLPNFKPGRLTRTNCRDVKKRQWIVPQHNSGFAHGYLQACLYQCRPSKQASAV